MNVLEGTVASVSPGQSPSGRASIRPAHPASALALLAMVCIAFPLLTTLATPSNASAQEWQRAQARARAEEMRGRADEVRRLSQEQAAEMRLQSRDLAREFQQVVIRAQARVRLGVELDPDQGPEYDRQGARVKGLLANSPAAKAGLRKDDIITHLNGLSLVEPLPDPDREGGLSRDESLPVQRLMALARDTGPGDQVEIRFLRNGRPETATFEAEEVGGRGLTILPRGFGLREGTIRVPEIHLDTLRIREQIIRVPEFRFDTLRGGVFRFDTEFPFDSLRVGAFRFDTEFPFDSLRVGAFRFDTEFPFDSLRVGAFRFDTEFPFDSLRGGALRGFALGDPQRPFVGMIYGRTFRGMELRDMNPELAPYFSTDRGVLVLDVDQDRELGLRPGDVILAIGDREVESVRDVRRILSSYGEEERVNFQVMREGRKIQVEARMD